MHKTVIINYTDGLLTHKDVIYVCRIIQRRGEGIKLHWTKRKKPDSNLNPQKEMKCIENGKYVD